MNGEATAANQTNGKQKSQLVDSTGVSFDITNPIPVEVTNATIEQTTGDTHNDLNIGVAGKDASGKVQPIPITANGVKVDGSAVTQPVSGTFWQATQPVSAASLPLPTGAATETTLADCKTALQIIDNFISGSKGLVTEDNSASIKTAVEALNTALQTGGISQVQFAAMVTALQTIDNFISGSRGLVTEDSASAIKTAVEAINTALQTSGITQVQLAAIKTAVETIDNFISGSKGLVTEDNSAAIKTALEIIDNCISGSEAQVDVVGALPAGTALIGKVYGSDSTGLIYSGTTALTPLFAAISATTDNGNNTIVAASAGYQIRVLALFLIVDAAVSVRFESAAGGTALTGVMPLTANMGFVLPYNPAGWFQTDTTHDDLLNLELTGTGNVYGSLTYILVPD
jgi:hypothetical protein